MSKYYSGMDGTLHYDDGLVHKVRNWTLSMETQALETTVLSQWHREGTTGLRSASGSCTILYYDDSPSKLIKQLLQDDIEISKTCKLRLGYDDKYFEFNALITGASTGASVGEVMSVGIRFQRTGPFTKTNY